MLRRLMLEEPPSQLAIWSRWCALFGSLVAGLAVILSRGRFVEVVPSLVILAGAMVLAGAAILLSLAAFVVIWNNGNPGLRWAVLGLFLGVGLIAYPAYVVAQGYRAAPIADVSTDTNDPPRFDVIARLRPPGANPIAFNGETAALQRSAYPDIVPRPLGALPAETYNAALEVVTRLKWRVVDTRTPQARRDGRIEAVALTTVMGFPEDVVIRVRSGAGGSVLDIRSASRYGQRDFGSNARRVQSLLDEIAEEIGNQPAAQ